MENPVKYYLFELGYTVVKYDGRSWFARDPELHLWKLDGEWRRRYDDSMYDVIEIDYDEENENIEAAQSLRGFHTLEFLIFKDGQPRKAN